MRARLRARRLVHCPVMRVTLTKTLTFDAAHWLPTFPDGHKCRRVHGHSYRVEIVLEGDVPPQRGYLVDFADVKAAAAPLIGQLDHQMLNDVEGLEIPTAEHIARWFYERLKPSLPDLAAIRLHETEGNCAEYRGS
jgi:6-pyruvoyltetrahydropterin/6-carboxytetrahydropterin synthase